MSITAEISLNQHTIDVSGPILLRFAKVVRNGTTELSRTWYRISLVPGDDLDRKRADNSDALVRDGFPRISDADWAVVTDAATRTWTTEILAAYRDRIG